MGNTLTSNYSLRKPAKGDTDWDVHQNWNLDTIDTQIKGAYDCCGTLGSLSTTAQSNLVAAINEVDGHADTAQLAAEARGWKKYSPISASVAVSVDDTYVGGGYAIAIPADSILRGFMIKMGVPSGTAGGTKTIQISVGTVINADEELTDATDYDVMAASGAKTAAATHGDETSDHTAAFFPMDNFGAYFAAPTNLYLNYIGKASDATANPGTVAATITVWALIDQLS